MGSKFEIIIRDKKHHARKKEDEIFKTFPNANKAVKYLVQRTKKGKRQ